MTVTHIIFGQHKDSDFILNKIQRMAPMVAGTKGPATPYAQRM